MANEYVDAETLKATLDLSDDFADDDIDLALEAASRALDEATHRRFWQDEEDVIRFYTPDELGHQWIDDMVELTEIATDRAGDGTFLAWDESEFVLYPLNAEADGRPFVSFDVHPRSFLALPAGMPRSVRVTGKFGWPAVPPAIKQATGILATKLLKRAREAPFGIASMGMDGVAVHLARVDPDIVLLTKQYQRSAGIA